MQNSGFVVDFVQIGRYWWSEVFTWMYCSPKMHYSLKTLLYNSIIPHREGSSNNKFSKSSTSFLLLWIQNWPWWCYPTHRALSSWTHNSAIWEVTWNDTLGWMQSLPNDLICDFQRKTQFSMKSSQKSKLTDQHAMTANFEVRDVLWAG